MDTRLLTDGNFHNLIEDLKSWCLPALRTDSGDLVFLKHVVSLTYTPETKTLTAKTITGDVLQITTKCSPEDYESLLSRFSIDSLGWGRS